jgi:hypothetical protein
MNQLIWTLGHSAHLLNSTPRSPTGQWFDDYLLAGAV